MDNATVTLKKGQGLTIVVEGYEDHAPSFHYDDVLQVILAEAQQTLNKRRNERLLEKAKAEQSLYPHALGQAANYPMVHNGLVNAR